MRPRDGFADQPDALVLDHPDAVRRVRVSLEQLAAHACDGRVFQCFGHYVLAGVGRLLATPERLCFRGQAQVVQGCPVPVEELLALIDPQQGEAKAYAVADDPERFWLAALARSHWCVEWIRLAPMSSPVMRLSHPSGIRYAEVMP